MALISSFQHVMLQFLIDSHLLKLYIDQSWLAEGSFVSEAFGSVLVFAQLVRLLFPLFEPLEGNSEQLCSIVNSRKQYSSKHTASEFPLFNIHERSALCLFIVLARCRGRIARKLYAHNSHFTNFYCWIFYEPSNSLKLGKASEWRHVPCLLSSKGKKCFIC